MESLEPLLKTPDLLHNRENEELKKIRIKDAMQFLGTYDLDHDHLSGKLFHLYPGFLKSQEDNPSLMDKYEAVNAKYYWATKVLEARAWAQFGRQQEEEVLDFILTKANDPAARGNAWEPYIHLLIESEGLKGIMRKLGSTDSEQLFSLKPGKTTFFKHFNEIDDSVRYWRPSIRNHPTCDAYIPEAGIMLQMTIGQSHSINVPGLQKALSSGIFAVWENAYPTERLKFIFVVDPFAYDEYQKTQRLQGGNQSDVAEVESRIEQFILKVDVMSRFRELKNTVSSKKRNREGRSEEREKKKIKVHRK